MRFSLIIISTIFLASVPTTEARAATTVAAAQREVDRLRTLAAEKYEDANETNIRIKDLEREMTGLVAEAKIVEKKLQKSTIALSRIAIANYQSSGFGDGFDLIFSADPKQYLKDSSVLNLIARNYATNLQEFAFAQQKVKASQFVISDRRSLLQKERIKLVREVKSAQESLKKAEKVLSSLKKADRAKLEAAEARREGKILSDSKKYASSYKGDNSRGSIALKYALQQVGDVYVWAAAGPTRWDCSGLTMRAFQQAGVSLPHSSRIQVRYGKNISYSSVKPGDLLFFGKPISHVSIYMGNGKMVQAPRPGKKVEVVSFTKKFGAKPFVGARRL